MAPQSTRKGHRYGSRRFRVSSRAFGTVAAGAFCPPHTLHTQDSSEVAIIKTSIRDISKATGFSPATVSNALNHKKNVRKATADRIIEAARDLGYYKASPVTRVRLVIFRENGSIIDNTPFFPTLISSFVQESREGGYETLLHNLDKRSPAYEEELSALLNDPDSGLVLLATEMNAADIQRFDASMSPLVILDNWTTDMRFSSVAINNEDSARFAGDYLIRQGHTRIGYIKSSFRIHNFRARHQGLDRALRNHALSLSSQDIITVTPNLEGAYEDTSRYLEHRRDLATAYFADNDLMGLGAMKAFAEHGFRIPQDVSIIGFDDLPFSALSSPPLTTVFVPNGELGAMAARRISHIIQQKETCTAKFEVGTRFVVRDTVAPGPDKQSRLNV